MGQHEGRAQQWLAPVPRSLPGTCTSSECHLEERREDVRAQRYERYERQPSLQRQPLDSGHATVGGRVPAAARAAAQAAQWAQWAQWAPRRSERITAPWKRLRAAAALEPAPRAPQTSGKLAWLAAERNLAALRLPQVSPRCNPHPCLRPHFHPHLHPRPWPHAHHSPLTTQPSPSPSLSPGGAAVRGGAPWVPCCCSAQWAPSWQWSMLL